MAAYGIQEQEVLQPVAAYKPDSQLQAAVPQAPSLISQGVPQVTEGLVAQQVPQVGTVSITQVQTAQLPPSQPTTATALTPQQKLAKLEERLVLGEIDQELYEKLKAKFDMEAKPFEPAPQLPPAQAPTTAIPDQPSTPPQKPQEQALVPEQSPPEHVIPPQETPPPETMQPPMEQPAVTEVPVEPVEPEQQLAEIPPDLPPAALPPAAYQQPPQSQNQPQSVSQPQVPAQPSQLQTHPPQPQPHLQAQEQPPKKPTTGTETSTDSTG